MGSRKRILQKAELVFCDSHRKGIILMKSDIDTFRSLVFNRKGSIGGGLQRPTRFEVYVENDDVGVLTWPVQTFSLPGRSLDGIPDELTAQGSNPRVIPIRRGYGGEPSILMGLLVDQNWGVRNFFEDWLDLYNPLSSPGSGRTSTLERTGSYSALTRSTVNLDFMDMNENRKWRLELIEPYPTSIIQESYSADQINQVATLNVTIGFKEYTTKQSPKD
jgi:hypothetical protein